MNREAQFYKDMEVYNYSFLVTDDGGIVGNKCHAYFHGSDGLGTCNTKCQWWVGCPCPMWITQDR